MLIVLVPYPQLSLFPRVPTKGLIRGVVIHYAFSYFSTDFIMSYFSRLLQVSVNWRIGDSLQGNLETYHHGNVFSVLLPGISVK